MNKSKGFTIIELIVVIAIIAVLAVIVLVSVTQYITKGKNAAIEGNLATLLTNSAAYYDSNGTFDDFKKDNSTGCGADSPIVSAIENADYGGIPPTCSVSDDGTAWCGCAPLDAAIDVSAGTVFCVDSTGAKKTATPTDCGTECPSTGACL